MAAADDHATLSELAERLGVDDEERDQFVSSSMKRLGYKPRTDWDDPDPDENKGNGGGDFFSRKREQNQRQQREVPGRGGQQRQRQQSGGYDY